MIDTITQRDIFEQRYISVFLSSDPYIEAKLNIESLRFDLTYSDDHIAAMYTRWVRGEPFNKDSDLDLVD